jgi:hypothetical protein
LPLYLYPAWNNPQAYHLSPIYCNTFFDFSKQKTAYNRMIFSNYCNYCQNFPILKGASRQNSSAPPHPITNLLL